MSICKQIKILVENQRNILILLILISLFSLGLAFFTEYVLGFPPCKLCIYQRWPYVFLAIIALANLTRVANNKITNLLIIVTISAAISIAGYHTGVERGLFEASATCNPDVKLSAATTDNDFLQMLEDKPIASCAKAPFKVLYLSMTEWNLLFNLALLSAYLLLMKCRYAKT